MMHLVPRIVVWKRFVNFGWFSGSEQLITSLFMSEDVSFGGYDRQCVVVVGVLPPNCPDSIHDPI